MALVLDVACVIEVVPELAKAAPPPPAAMMPVRIAAATRILVFICASR
jgi:hypothetical protein